MDIIYKEEWDKSLRGVGTGWGKRNGITTPKTIIVHTTNGRRNTKFKNEVEYIVNANHVGAHFIISKAGEIVQTLHPKFQAWHAGSVNDQRFNNNNSIGIEVHYTPGEGKWTQEMHTSLTYLCGNLIKEYNISAPQLIETHRRVATNPPGRKIDPSGFTDTEFYAWRADLFDEIIPSQTVYRVIFNESIIRQGPSRKYKEAGRLSANDIFTSVIFKHDETGEYIGGINTWAHVTSGMHNGLPVDGLGFMHTSLLKIIG